MKSNSDILKYKSQICDITKDPNFQNKKFAYGYTSTVYRLGDSVIKETYLSKYNLENNNFFQELEANIFFREHPKLQKYAIPFEGFEICDKKIYTKYQYVGNSLESTIIDYSPKQLNVILEKTLEILKDLHKYIIHGDLHTGNIFVEKDKKGNIERIFFGDWGRAIIKGETVTKIEPGFEVDISEKNDYLRFLKEFKYRIIYSNFFKNVNIKKALTLLANKGQKKVFFDTLNLKLNERRRKYSFRPKELLENLKPYFFNKILYKSIKKSYGEKFIIDQCKFSKSIFNILDKIDQEVKFYEE